MNKFEYIELQRRLTNKINNKYNKYKSSKYAEAYEEGLLTAKSILADYYKWVNKEKNE